MVAAATRSRLGILHSLSGLMAISERSLADVEKMAIEEINDAGGLLGKKIEPIVEDSKSEMETGFPDKAKEIASERQGRGGLFRLLDFLQPQMGVLPVFTKNNGLLFYPVQYEGNECSKNVVYTGAAPNQQIIPAVDYILEKMGRKKFYLLGSDYIFPQTANQVIKAVLKKKYNTEPVAEKLVPMTQTDFKTVVDDIKQKKPDVIFSTINGDSNLPFYREMAENKISAQEMPICAVSVAEDELRGLVKVEGAMKGAQGPPRRLELCTNRSTRRATRSSSPASASTPRTRIASPTIPSRRPISRSICGPRRSRRPARLMWTRSARRVRKQGY